MKFLVTGGAGFIGSHLVEKLVDAGHEVSVIDNFSSGRETFLAGCRDAIELSVGDLLDTSFLDKIFSRGADFVLHLAANPEVRIGAENPKLQVEQNLIATFNVLEAMREHKIKKIGFTSTSAVYGEAAKIPTPEDYPTIPISIYGASKLGCESLIASYCHTFDMQSWLFRFANVVGPRGTHGVIVDFISKLRKNPAQLEILGDGKQKKSYMYVDDCVDGMLFAIKTSTERVNIFNLGSDDWIEVRRIAEMVVEEMHLGKVKFTYTGGDRGWAGDVPRMMLSIDKINALGWHPRLNSEDSVRMAVRHLISQ